MIEFTLHTRSDGNDGRHQRAVLTADGHIIVSVYYDASDGFLCLTEPDIRKPGCIIEWAKTLSEFHADELAWRPPLTGSGDTP